MEQPPKMISKMSLKIRPNVNQGISQEEVLALAAEEEEKAAAWVDKTVSEEIFNFIRMPKKHFIIYHYNY
jgi:hypothetical protein